MGAKSSKASGPKTVAVCGATGQQGGAVVDALLALGKGYTVRALTRDPAAPKAAALAAKPGVEVVKGDFNDPASLKSAFDGCDAVFAVTDFWAACALDPFKEKEQGINLVDAAAATPSVAHFVFSTLEDTRPGLAGEVAPVNGTYTVPHFDAKAEVNEYAKEKLGKKLTSVYTSVFYENLLPGKGMGPTKQADGSFSLFMGTGDAQMAWCTVEDIGGVAAAVIAQGPRRWGGKAVGVAGEHASAAEVAAAMTRALGKPVGSATAPAAAWAAAVQGYGVPELAAKDLGNMFLFYEKCGMLELRPLAATKKLYPGTQGLEAWLGKHKEELLAAMAG